MGFIADLFSGSKAYQAQSGLQPGQLGETYQQQQDALQKMMAFVAATQPGSAQGLAAQQALSQQLGAMGQGQGPSAATAMLQQQAGDIAAQQAALMGSQRGASQNVGLVGRQSAQAGMQAQQRAGSQAAILRQQEQLSALEQLRQLSGQQVEQQRLGTAQAGQAALQAQQQALAAQQAQEAQRTAMAQQQEQTRGGIIGGLLGGLGAVAGSGVLGGSPVKKAEGGMIAQDDQRPPEEKEMDIVSLLLQGQPSPMAEGALVPGHAKVDGDSYENDTVHALLSPGEIVVPRSAAKDPEKAAAFAKSVAMRSRKKKK